MRSMACAAVLFVALAASLSAQTPSGSSPPSFMALFHPGQNLVVSEENGGYVLTTGENLRASPAIAADQRAAEYSELARRLAQVEYERVVSANRAVPNTFPASDVNRLQLQLQQATLRADQAKQKAAEPVIWEVSAVGGDYLGLQSAKQTMFVPLQSIRAVLQLK